jgi:HK97 family phage major capsid protein
MNGGPGSNPISWVERNPKEGGPAWTLELATKPGMDWTYVRNSAEAQYIAVTTEVTKQALLSMPILQQEIYDLLQNELNNKLEQDIITGSGVAPIIKGIQTYATAFAAGSLAGTIQDPNDFDVLRVAIGQVLKANYFPNAILVSIDTATAMDLTKAADGHYVLPPFTTADGTVIKGVRVYASNFIPNDSFIVGDMARYLFNIVEGLTIDVGYINDQFVKNMATLRAELFGMGRVKNHETLAFVKGTFTAAKAALEIPTP